MRNLTCGAELLGVPRVELLNELLQCEGHLAVHRLDLCCPFASGNKAFKLKGYFLAARRAGKNHILSFGGAWSNHLHALAYYSAKYQFESTAIVRGLHTDLNNPMLLDASRNGMKIICVSKDDYARRREPGYLEQLQRNHPDAWIIPEGGDDPYGRWGIAALASTLRVSIPSGETLVVASGTGATVRGLAIALKQHLKLVSALVVDDVELASRIKRLCAINSPDIRLVDASGRGYGRIDELHLDTLQSVLAKTGMLLDPLYNGKAWKVAVALAEQGERVHLLHTGGVQGWRGFLERGLLQKHPLLKKSVETLSYSPSF